MPATAEHAIDRILDAVRSLRAGGDSALSYRTIARKAGLSSGTVSYYFASRAALLEAALDRHHARVAELLSPFLDKAGLGPGPLARRLTKYAFANQGDIRLRLSAWVESWSLPATRRANVDQVLRRIGERFPLDRWTKEEQRVIVQSLGWGAQRFAALTDEELCIYVGVDDPAEAQRIVVETMGKLAEALAEDQMAPTTDTRH
tara:strand:+ start:3926 stop:4534 length:609 start_codon:yes stop_codon:yes gene_type:complete